MSSFDKPKNHQLRGQTRNQPWLFLFFSSGKYCFVLMTAILITAFSSMLHPAAAVLCGRIFSSLNLHKSGSIRSSQMAEDVGTSCISLAILGCLSWVIECGFMSFWIIHGEGQAKEARDRLFNNLLSKKMEWYDLREDGFESLLVRIEALIKDFQFGISQPLGFIMYEVFGSFLSLGIAFYRSWQLTLIILGILPLMAIALWPVSNILKSAIEKQIHYQATASKYASASIKASSTVKAYNAQDYELRQYKKSLNLVTKNYISQARANALQLAFIKFTIVFCFVGGFWFGLYLVTNGKDPGDIVITFYTTLSVMQSIETISTQWIYISRGVAAGNALNSLLLSPNIERLQNTALNTVFFNINNSDIELKRVSFSYPGNPNNHVINKVNLFFPACKTTYLVGSSGSGKSTIGKILMRFYTFTQGDVLIDGKSIYSFPQEWLNDKITYVDQDSYLFNETIFQNIAFGSFDSVCREDVINAGRIANLETMLKGLPNGLDTIVSHGGKSLSGGQRQKVSITRAKLRDSPILILDEVTCALDQTSRNLINDQIRKWRKGKTTIIITHDISQILDDEYVYIMDKGYVVQGGFREQIFKERENILLPNFSISAQKTEIDSSKNCPESWNMTHLITCKSTVLESNSPNHKQLNESVLCGHMNEEKHIDFSIDSHKILIDTENPVPRISFDLEYETILNYESDYSSDPGSLESVSNPFKKLSKWWEKKFEETQTQTYLPLPSTDTLETFNLKSMKKSTSKTTLNAKNEEKFFPIKDNSLLRAVMDKSEIHPESLKNICSSMWPRLSQQDKLELLFGIAACLATAMTAPLSAYFISNLMKLYHSTHDQLQEGTRWAIALFCLAFVDSISIYCSCYYLERVGQAWVTTIRVECLQILLAQPKAWLDKDTNSPLMLAQYLDKNTEEMRNLVGRFVGPIFTSFVMLSISIIWSLFINWKLTIVALSCGPLIYAGTCTFNWTTSRYEEKCSAMAENTSNIFMETLSNVRLVRSLRLEAYFLKKHRAGLALAYSVGLRRAFYSGLTYGFISDTISFLTTALVAFYGVTLIIENNLSIFGCLQIINLLLFGLGYSLTTVSLMPQFNSSRVSAKKVILITEISHCQSHESQGTERITSPFPIVFKELSFTYSNSANRTLRNINLTFRKGTFTVITGSSGSGKSTLISLLLGFYLPDASRTPSLSFADTPIQQCHIATLRNFMAIVSQDSVIFPDTIYANITYGLPENSIYANLEAVKDAARNAGIADFIESLERGFLTKIGEGGMGVSGGQAQRIMIARALIRHPKLLIMDEPTSSLDKNSAAKIRRTIQKLRAQHFNEMAVVIISHSVEMMAISDQIIVLKHGEIVERGEFQHLWKQEEGEFRKITSGEGTNMREWI